MVAVLAFLKGIDFKKYLTLKNLVIVALVILIILVALQRVRIKKLKDQKHEAEVEREQLARIANQQKEQTTHYINLYNQEVANVKAMELTHDNFIRLKDSEHLDFLKQFNGVKKNLKNLQAAASFDMTMFGPDLPEPKTIYIPCKDSVKVFKYEVKDEFNDIYAMVVDSPRLEIKVPLKVALFWERSRRFWFIKYGEKRWTMEAYSPNRFVKIDSMQIYKVEKLE